MGVPGFYRELIKLFPNIVKTNIKGRVDYFYIDCNCLLHPQCFKVLALNIDETDQDKLFELMCTRILAFIDYLDSFINPQTLFYLAIDGVAPLAKMSQQRLRRMYGDNYRGLVMKKNNIKHNSSWSNIVITPGTEFMYKLHLRLLEYFEKKINLNESENMKTCEYVYSSYKTHGEGEHKILQHIKKNIDIKSKKNIVIYGLDADLIFLAMASQYTNIYLLRESDQINQDKVDFDDPQNVTEELLYLDIDETKKSINLHLNKEFNRFTTVNEDICFDNDSDSYSDSDIFNNNDNNSKTKKTEDVDVDFKFDFCNDYIFICYFLGNDFLPHLPSVDIKVDGMNMVIDSYLSVVERRADTMIKLDKGSVKIDPNFLYEFIRSLSAKEENFFRSTLPDHINKLRNRRCHEVDKYKRDLWYVENLFSTIDKEGNMSRLRITDHVRLGVDSCEDWKYRYYEHYFHTDTRQDEIVYKICENYVDGLYWVAKYYFNECPTWRWQYRYTHAPFLSDIANYLEKNGLDQGEKDIFINKESNVGFNVEFKFEPHVDMFVQLVSVIPQRHSNILPDKLRFISSSADSPVIDMYPTSFPLDMINKTQLYKCVPHVPYLDVGRLEKIVSQIKMPQHENKRFEKTTDIVFKKKKQTIFLKKKKPAVKKSIKKSSEK